MAEGGRKIPEEELYECLKSLNVPVRMSDLKSPTREFIVRVFECFLKDLQLDITSPILKPWNAVQHIEDADISEDGQLLVLLVMSINHVTFNFDLNITIRDVIEPKPKRTKKILNYLIVFWNYYLRMIARFNAIQDTFEKEKQKGIDLANENESLDNEIAEKLKILQNMQPSREELEKTCDAKEEIGEKLKKECENLQTEYSRIKSKAFDLKNQIDTTTVTISKSKDTLTELSQMILSSPKQKLIDSEIKMLEEKIKDVDAKTKECESAYKDEMKKLQLLERDQNDLEKVKNTFIEIRDIDKQFSETVKNMVDAHQQINDVEDKLKRLEMELERKEAWQLQQEQKSAQFLLNRKKQLETLRELLKMNISEETKLKKQDEFVISVVEETQAKIDIEGNEVLEVIRRCKEADAKSKKREAQFKSRLQELSNLFKSDCDEIMENLQNTFPYELED